MKIVRNNVFETNSSSSHSIALSSEVVDFEEHTSIRGKWERRVIPILLMGWEYGYQYVSNPIPVAIGFEEKLSYLLSGCFEEAYNESQEKREKFLEEFENTLWFRKSQLLMKFCLSSKSGKLLNEKMKERGFYFEEIENYFFIEGDTGLYDIGIETSLTGSPSLYSLVEKLDDFLFNDQVVVVED